MKTRFTSKFEKQVSKINSPKLKQDILSIIQQAENARSVHELKNLKKLMVINLILESGWAITA